MNLNITDIQKQLRECGQIDIIQSLQIAINSNFNTLKQIILKQAQQIDMLKKSIIIAQEKQVILQLKVSTISNDSTNLVSNFAIQTLSDAVQSNVKNRIQQLNNRFNILQNKQAKLEQITQKLNKQSKTQQLNQDNQRQDIKNQEMSKFDLRCENQMDYLSQSQILIDDYLNKSNVRQGMPNYFIIFFVMKDKYWTQVFPQVESKKSVEQQNRKIKQILQNIEGNKRRLIRQNKWLSQLDLGGYIDFSGTQSQGVSRFRRYLYGQARLKPRMFIKVWEQIEGSKEFVVLKHKTYYAMKSMFYAKDKMKKIIQQMNRKVESFGRNYLCEVDLNNLPPQFSMDFILELLVFVGVRFQDLIEIKIMESIAKVSIIYPSVHKMVNLEGYCYSKGHFIEVQIKQLKIQITERKKWFQIQLDSQYRINYTQLFDCMAIERSKTGRQKYRWIIHQNFLTRIAMFKGPNINIKSIRQMCKQQNRR